MKSTTYLLPYSFLLLLFIPVKSQSKSGNSSAFLSDPSYKFSLVKSGLAARPLMVTIMFTVTPIAMLLHLAFMYIILSSKKRQKYKNAFYQLVVVISTTDIYWSGYVFYQGFCNVLDQCPFGELGNVIISTGAQYMFFLCMNMDMLIAFNRFAAIVLAGKYDRIFSLKKGIIYVLLFMVISAMECMPSWVYKKKYYVELQTFAFATHPPEEFVRLIIWLELACTYVAHAFLAVLYIWSFVVYRRHIRCAQNIMSAEKKKEGRLLIQAVFSGIPCIVIMTFHHLIRLPLVELLGAEWCLLNGPFVYLWFNSEIRSDFLELIRLKKATRKTYLNTFIQMRRQNTINDTYGMSGIGSEKGIWMGSGASEHAPPLPISDQKTSEGMNRDP